MGVMLTLVTDITLEDIMWEDIRGGSVVESTVAELMDPREDGEDPREVGEEIRGEDPREVRGAKGLKVWGEDPCEDREEIRGEDPREDGEEIRGEDPDEDAEDPMELWEEPREVCDDPREEPIELGEDLGEIDEKPLEVIVSLVTDTTWEVIVGGTVVERTDGDGDWEGEMVDGGGSVVTRASKASWAASKASDFADKAFFSASEQASTFERYVRMFDLLSVWEELTIMEYLSISHDCSQCNQLIKSGNNHKIAKRMSITNTLIGQPLATAIHQL